MRKLQQVLALDIVRGLAGGLVGTAGGMGLTLLVRGLLGLAAWEQGTVITAGILAGVIIYLVTVGVFKYWFDWARGGQPPEGPSGKGSGWARYFNVNTDHKVIGVQYLVTALVFLPFAVVLQLIGRLELSQAINISAASYELIISDHGIVMLFIVVIPGIAGLMNYLVPLMIGARDVAFPRLNAFSYWLIPPAGLLTVLALPAGGFDTGWTVYAPLSAEFAPGGMNLILIGVYLGGLSSILGAINFLTTIFKMRAPGMGFFRLPVFVWSSLATTGLALVFTQFVAMSFLMVLLERIGGFGFFNPAMGGQVLLYQYLFWFYSHPAVYIFILPGLGIISDIIPVFARKPLFGYKAVAVSSPAIALGGTVVFVHHMFAAGIPDVLRVPFMVTTLLVAVPTGIKMFAWVATLWMGKLILATPFLFVVSALLIFLVGGLTGVPVGIVPTDLYLHDTYFVVAHFHGTLFGGFLFPLMAAIYYWFPKLTGRLLGERAGKLQWLLMTAGVLLLILPMFGLGLEGMRRRVENYDPAVISQTLHIITAVGGFLVFAGLVVLVINLIRSLGKGEPSGSNPWKSRTLEWQVSSPPPAENFVRIPRVVGSPYGYGVKGSIHAIMDPEEDSERESKGA